MLEGAFSKKTRQHPSPGPVTAKHLTSFRHDNERFLSYGAAPKNQFCHGAGRRIDSGQNLGLVLFPGESKTTVLTDAVLSYSAYTYHSHPTVVQHTHRREDLASLHPGPSTPDRYRLSSHVRISAQTRQARVHCHPIIGRMEIILFVNRSFCSSVSFARSETSERRITALHWAFAHFGSAVPQVWPQNTHWVRGASYTWAVPKPCSSYA